MKGKAVVFVVTVAAMSMLLFSATGAVADPAPGVPTAPAGAALTLTGATASQFSYQGRLTDTAGRPVSRVVTMRFQLYNVSSGGAPLWDSGAQSVPVSNGVFSVVLNAGQALFDGQALWLGFVVEGETLPRQAILAAPYALGLVPGVWVNGASSSPLFSATNADGSGIAAVRGEPAVEAGEAHIVVIEASRPITIYPGLPAVLGQSQNAPGVSGMSQNGDGAEGWSVTGNGVEGGSRSGYGGIFGSNENYGLRVVSAVGKGAYITGDVRVDGEVYAESFHVVADGDPAGAPVAGIGLDGEFYARSFHTKNPAGAVTSGVDTAGNAGYKAVTAQDGFRVPTGGGASVNTLTPAGLWLTKPDGQMTGMWDSSSGQLRASGDVWVEGGLHVFGEKNAVVTTASFGQRKLYAEEAAEQYFFDRGQGQLLNGVAIVELDPVYLETITIDANHPMLVQVTLTSDCRGVFVAEKSAYGFTVRELMNGASNATFDWEVAAKRKGYEDERLEPYSQAPF